MTDDSVEINRDLVKKVVMDVEEDMSNEEILNMLLKRKVSVNANEKYTFGQKASDKVARFTGSWQFLGIFSFIVVFWIVLKQLLADRFASIRFFPLCSFKSRAGMCFGASSSVNYDESKPTRTKGQGTKRKRLPS